MKHFKGTKGEWHNNGLEVRSVSGLLIADVYEHLQINKSKEQGLADAQLIAAAPELLKALQSCVLSMQAHPDCEENSEFEGFVNKGQEAINKALGQ